VGGELLGAFTDFSYMEPLRHELRVRLPSGLTPIVVSTWQVAFREVRHVVSLRIGGLPVRVAIPSPGADEHVSAVAERLLNAGRAAEALDWVRRASRPGLRKMDWQGHCHIKQV